MNIEKIKLCEGINLHILPDDKFKNFVLGAFISTPLSPETASQNALLPRVLSSGCEKYKSKKEISLHLAELYGARLSAGIQKSGEEHVISIYIDAVAGKFTDGGNTEVEVAEMLEEILLRPLLVNGAFDGEIVSLEKNTVKNVIEGMINDKRRYALHRCTEEMCSGEAFGIGQFGTIEDVMAVDSETLYSHYKNVISNSPIDFVAAGKVERSTIIELVKGIAAHLGSREAEYTQTYTAKFPSEVKYIKEEADVVQGKLVMGFRTGVQSQENDYYTLMVYNGILGGSPASKMFCNVREKMSLCYYASSMLDRKKGIMLAQAGIETSNYQKALDAILLQLEDVKNGKFSDEELASSKAAIVNSLLSYKDDIDSIVAFYSSKFGWDKIDTIDEMCEKIAAVDRTQIIPVAKKIMLDTVYFLSGREA